MTDPNQPHLEVGDIVLCTVERIDKTSVFVRIEDNGEGSIILSEIAPGRIRNLRDYVVPKKKIVCKVLRVLGDRIDLSLRRVTLKETKKVLEEYNQEKSYRRVIEGLLKDKAKKIIEEILKKEKISEFLSNNKDNPVAIEKIMGKEAAKKIIDILNNQKKKTVIVKKDFVLKSSKPNGLTLLKEVLGEIKDAEVKYISAGKYSVQIESSDAKKADQRIKQILDKLEEEAKKKGMEFNLR